MLPRQLGVIMITVSEMERSVQFYRDVLGLPALRVLTGRVRHGDGDAALHSGGTPRAAPARVLRSPRIKTGWYVKNLDAACPPEGAGAAVREGADHTPGRRGIRLAVFLDRTAAAFLAQRITSSLARRPEHEDNCSE